jgi:hypothetical protein
VGKAVKDGRSWPSGADKDVDWIANGTAPGLGITAAIPPVFSAYATVLVDEKSSGQPWWLGYLDTGSDDVVFSQAPRVTLYAGWRYVLVQAGPEEAASWRQGPPWPRGVIPDLLFPVDRTWLVSRLWDDDWRCLGGPADLVGRVVTELPPHARRVRVDDEDATPPGHVAR